MSIIVPLEGFGGGSNPLNFKVVGNPKPESPSENTIWLNTDVPIRSWQFASDDPNLLDFSNWANEVSVVNGTKGVSGGTFTLTATANDCYTDFDSTRATNIPCTPGKTYVMEWEHSGANGEVYIFPNGNVDGLVMAGEASGKIEFTPTDGISFFTFRFGARIANTTATYSNIRITEKDRAFKPGGVWILTGASPHVEFNALKKNGIQVYPISAKQYVDGAWLDKTAKSYQAGAWTEWWNGVLFDNGDNTEVTGGWRQGGDVTTFTVSDHIYLHTTNFADGGYGMTNNAIDLTGYSSILVNCDSIGVDTDGRSKVYVSSSFGSDMAASVSITGTGEYSMDISNLQGLYYIGVFSKDNGDFSVNKIVVKA